MCHVLRPQALPSQISGQMAVLGDSKNMFPFLTVDRVSETATPGCDTLSLEKKGASSLVWAILKDGNLSLSGICVKTIPLRSHIRCTGSFPSRRSKA